MKNSQTERSIFCRGVDKCHCVNVDVEKCENGAELDRISIVFGEILEQTLSERLRFNSQDGNDRTCQNHHRH